MSDRSEHLNLHKAFVALIGTGQRERDVEATARRLLMLGHAVVGQVKGLAKERLTLATTGVSGCPTMVIWHCGEPICCPRIPDTAPYRHSSFR